MKAQTITRDEWLDALGEVVKPCEPNAVTVNELAERYRIGRQAAFLRVKQLVRDGKARQTWKLQGNRHVRAYALSSSPTNSAGASSAKRAGRNHKPSSRT